jgi:hypothetical protein
MAAGDGGQGLVVEVGGRNELVTYNETKVGL